MVSTGGSSNKYGKCEICKKETSEIFQQSRSELSDFRIIHIGNTFGHKECLMGIRK